MVVPPDSNNPPTASGAGEQHGGGLTLNGPTSAADFVAVPDLRLEPDFDSLSTFLSEYVPLERRDSVPPGAPTQAQPPSAAILWPAARTGDADRSWLSRLLHIRPSAHDASVTMEADILRPADRTGDADRSRLSRSRSLKASSEKEHVRRSAHDEPVTMEEIRNLEKHLASLAALRHVCASIDQRLARVEEVSGQRDGAAIDEALHDLCSQMYDRLVRVEAAIQRTEGFVAEKPWDLSTIAHTRLERVEETLRLTQKTLADSIPPEMYVNIERQLVQARMALQRTEEAVADKTLHELCQNIDARLERTEDALHRSEGIVADSLQELSARMTARFAEIEETNQRIERMVSSRTVEQTPSQQPSVRMDNRPVHAEETARPLERPLGGVPADVDLRSRAHATSESGEPADGGVLAHAVLFLSRFVSIKQGNRPIRLQWMARLAVPVLVLMAASAIGALIRTSPGVAPTSPGVAPEKVVPLTTTDQISTPVVPATNEGIRAPSTQSPSTPAPTATAPRSTRQRRVSAPRQPSPNRESASTTTRPPTFVGTLSITSVPSGASVSINGEPAGVTPLKLPRQQAGSLAVQIAHDGFERWSAAVLVPADRLTEVTATLRATAR